jgi:hypothetical protein
MLYFLYFRRGKEEGKGRRREEKGKEGAREGVGIKRERKGKGRGLQRAKRSQKEGEHGRVPKKPRSSHQLPLFRSS